MIFSILYISNQKYLIKNQQSFYHLVLNLMTLRSILLGEPRPARMSLPSGLGESVSFAEHKERKNDGLVISKQSIVSRFSEWI